MISCDTNILFAAFESTTAGHEAAREFLKAQSTNTGFVLCELVLVEFYVLMRNPATARRPLGSAQAVGLVRTLRSNPSWQIVDYPGAEAGIMTEVWEWAGAADFARRRIFDVRLALALRRHRVTEFATANVKDFRDFGFSRVWNPMEATRTRER